LSGSLQVEQKRPGVAAAQPRRGSRSTTSPGPYDLAYEAGVPARGVQHLARPAGAAPRFRRGAERGPDQPGRGDRRAWAVPLLRRVAQDLETYSLASAERLSTVVLNLITTAGGRAPRPARIADRGKSQQQTLLLRIHTFIEQRLGDTSPRSPAPSAAAHHISVRVPAPACFETRNTTVAAWIRHRRLERWPHGNLGRRGAPGGCRWSAVAARSGLPGPRRISAGCSGGPTACRPGELPQKPAWVPAP